MNVHRVPFACTLLVLIACALFPKGATAQYSVTQCLAIQLRATAALKERAFKERISLEREMLTYCKEYMQGDDYTGQLGGLASALNHDNQHEEALAVANRCLEIDARNFGCIYEKAAALESLGRVSEAESVVERSLSLPAITELDVTNKEALKKLKAVLAARP
jgi:Flp pilus assembly protein TadD